MAALVRAYEERWIDLPVPALGGRTPREAARDPRMRERLDAPLAAPSGVMDTDRLRRRLGLAGQ